MASHNSDPASASSSALVRAAGFRRFGGPEVMETVELPRPVAGSGEVAVEVAAATVNPTDVLMMEGSHASRMQGLVPPYVAGMEFAGRVRELGPGVAGLSLGQAVMGLVNPRRPGGGAQAEYICVPAASVVPVPANVGMAAAATVPMNGLTAWMCLQALGLQAGQVLLVTGAAGAVGTYVTQLARHAGLRVVADAKDADRARVRAAGADDIVPRGAGMAKAVRGLFPGGVDALVDAALLGDEAAALVRADGAVALLRTGQALTDTRVRVATIGVMQRATHTEALAWVADRVRDGTLRPQVAARVPMAHAREAYAQVRQGGLRGRVVLTFDGAGA